MKRQTKLNKHLANKKVNRRHTAQLKRNAHNNAIFQEELLKQNQYSYLIKQLKLKKLSALNKLQPCLGSGVDLIDEKENLEFEDVSNEILDAEFEEVKVD